MALEPIWIKSILAVLLLGTVITDLKSRRIPNSLILLGIVVALTAHFHREGIPGVLFSLKGLGIGILLLIIPFFLGGMGAGDVKLLGMVGAFGGQGFVISTFIWMALIGGVIAIIYLVREGRLRATLKRWGRGLFLFLTLRQGRFLLDSADKQEFKIYFPYGLAIALGTMAAYWKGW